MVVSALFCDSAMIVSALAWISLAVLLWLFLERLEQRYISGLGCDLRSASGGGCASSLASGAKDAPIKLAVRRPSSRAVAVGVLTLPSPRTPSKGPR